MTTHHDVSQDILSNVLAFDGGLTIDETNMLLRMLQANPVGLLRFANLLVSVDASLTTLDQTQK